MDVPAPWHATRTMSLSSVKKPKVPIVKLITIWIMWWINSGFPFRLFDMSFFFEFGMITRYFKWFQFIFWFNHGYCNCTITLHYITFKLTGEWFSNKQKSLVVLRNFYFFVRCRSVVNDVTIIVITIVSMV